MPPPPETEGGRNGEPSELDWGCLFFGIVVVALLVVLGILLLTRTLVAY